MIVTSISFHKKLGLRLNIKQRGTKVCDRHARGQLASADPEGGGQGGGGGGGGRGSGPPPGKSQGIWVSVGNKQLDPPPPPPGKCWTSPLENVGPPLEP